MEKKVIRTNRLANMGRAADGQRKLKLFSDAYELCSEHIEIVDKIEFSKGFKNYLVTILRDKAKNIGIDHFQDHKVLEFYQVPVHILDEIQNRFNELRHIQLNKDFTQAILPDINVYASTPSEIERLSHVEQLIDALNKIQDNRHHIDWWGIAQATSGAIVSTGKGATPSERYVKSRRF
jgi:hypothetical protein